MRQLLSSILLNNPSAPHGHTCLLHPHSLSTQVSTRATRKPPIRQETLATAAVLQTLGPAELWSPCVHCVSSLTQQVGVLPSSCSWPSQHYVKWGIKEGHVSAPTISNTMCMKLIALWMRCGFPKPVKSTPYCLAAPMYLHYLHLIFGVLLIHCKQEFSQWYW